MEPTRKSRKRRRFGKEELHSASDSDSCAASDGGRTAKPLEGDNPDAKRRRRDTPPTNSAGIDGNSGHTTRRRDERILCRKRDMYTRPLVTEQRASFGKDNRKHVRTASSKRCEEQVPDKALPIARNDVQRLCSSEVCRKSFSRRSNLKRHCLAHSGEKPFQCKVCGKAFCQKKSFENHQRVPVTRGRNRIFAMCAEKHLRRYRALVDMNGIKHKGECETGLSQPDAR